MQFLTCHNFPQFLDRPLRQLHLLRLVKAVHELLRLGPVVPVRQEEEALQIVGERDILGYLTWLYRLVR